MARLVGANYRGKVLEQVARTNGPMTEVSRRCVNGNPVWYDTPITDSCGHGARVPEPSYGVVGHIERPDVKPEKNAG